MARHGSFRKSFFPNAQKMASKKDNAQKIKSSNMSWISIFFGLAMTSMIVACGPSSESERRPRPDIIEDDDIPDDEYDEYIDTPGSIQPQIRGNAVFPSITEYPWMVSFQYEDKQTGTWHHYCGGAIIGKNSIATASHCMFNNKKKYFIHTRIQTGDQNFTDTTDFNDFVKTYEISTIIKHPEYQGRGGKNDLAIAFTKTEIDFNITTNSIALPSIDDPIRAPNTNYSAKFTGYGYFDTTATTSDALREADFTIYTGTYCEPLFTNNNIKNHLVKTTIMMCAGTADNSTWTCPGDSGGPLVHEWRQEYVLLGVLHGSRANQFTCNPTTAKNPSLFANLEEEGNLEFLQTWKKLESFFLKDDLDDLESQTSLSINYLENLGPSPVRQSLWRHYVNNEDIHSVIFFKMCQNSNTATTIVDCSLYNSKLLRICWNGKSDKDNLEMYGVNCSITRILVVTGGGKKTELWPKPESQCALPDFPLGVEGAVGFWTAQGPMVCGGWRVNKCFLYKKHQWMPSTNMGKQRGHASALQITSNQAIIIGGSDESGYNLKTTEVITPTGSKEGKDFPVKIKLHCSFKINSTHALVTGGYQDRSFSASTWFVDLTTTRFTPGPKMTSRRDIHGSIGSACHGCATLQLGRKIYGIVAGGYYRGNLFDSTEWIDLEEDSPTWTEGPKLPRGLRGLTLVETTQGTYALGGYGYESGSGGSRSEVLHLVCPGDQIQSCQWQEMPKKLEVGRSWHVSLSLPESYDICS